MGLFVSAFLASLPYTGTVRGGDDTAYLNVAYFSREAWFFGRYAHVYLLKLFIALCGGDPFLATRVWWSFVFAVTVAALAVAVRSIGPGLQLRTLAVTLFVLLAQTTVFGAIGAALADYSAMMFLTAAVAVYLHGLAFVRDRPPPRHEWHALAVGVLSMGAFRSKEVAAVLLLLPLLFLIEDGRLDLRRFARRIAYWTAGGIGVLSVLVLLDGWLLGNFLFTFDSELAARLRDMNFPDELAPRSDKSWFHVIWRPGGHPARLSLRMLWLGVVAAAVAAGLQRRRLELRLLHLLPIAYLVALIALYVWMPHPFSGRMLIPILPVACLMTGLLLRDAGLEEVPRGRLLAPHVLVPTALTSAVLLLVLVPYRLGRLAAADFLPVAALRRYGWEPDHFVAGVLLPALVLVVLSCLALVVASRRARVAGLLVAYVAFFGVGFEFNRTRLAQRWTAQTGELLLYPWTAFRGELEAARPRTVALSPDVAWRYHMSGPTRGSLARLALRRRDVTVVLSRDLPVEADVAIVSREVYRKWRRQAPELAATARVDAGGVLVLVRPKE